MSIGFSNFVPKLRIISNVTNSNDSIVTTTEPHEYQDGQFVRLYVLRPSTSQAYPTPSVIMSLNAVMGQVTVIDSTNFYTGVDTSFMYPYTAIAYPPGFTQNHVVPITGTWQNIAGKT